MAIREREMQIEMEEAKQVRAAQTPGARGLPPPPRARIGAWPRRAVCWERGTRTAAVHDCRDCSGHAVCVAVLTGCSAPGVRG